MLSALGSRLWGGGVGRELWLEREQRPGARRGDGRWRPAAAEARSKLCARERRSGLPLSLRVSLPLPSSPALYAGANLAVKLAGRLGHQGKPKERTTKVRARRANEQTKKKESSSRSGDVDRRLSTHISGCI